MSAEQRQEARALILELLAEHGPMGFAAICDSIRHLPINPIGAALVNLQIARTTRYRSELQAYALRSDPIESQGAPEPTPPPEAEYAYEDQF